MRPISRNLIVAACLLVAAANLALGVEPSPNTAAKPVSFYGQLRPVFQANCQGCHQPAKAKGGYVMTEFEKLFAPGETGDKPIVAGQPDTSLLVKQITPKNGEAEMPKGKPPLAEHEIELVRRWIAEGAKDDTPANAKQRYDADHPPVYTHPPVITSMDYSTDGSLIAVAGFHEVLLHKADGSGIAGRLIGLSERIQSVRFSPDGKQLAVAGGQPARMGEIQIWDVEKRKLIVSVPVGYDTASGVNWSPDGKLLSFGLPDKTVRAIEASSGKQVLQQGSHNDWVLDTVFSTDGSHVVSVGRDMSAKLTEVATQRFVDNITSITPGGLRGGLQTIARHPTRNEILVGGADGTPQVYQIFRTAARKIGDNAALLRRFQSMEGRVFSVDYSPDGNRIAAGASLDSRGTVHIYAAQFNSTIPTNILKAYEKTAGEYTADERKAIEDFVTSEIKLLHSVSFSNAAIYALSFSPDGRQIAAAGSDGQIRLISAEQGKVEKEFAAAISTNAPASVVALDKILPGSGVAASVKDAIKESYPKDAEITALEIQPARVSLHSRSEHIQFLVTARLGSGDSTDVTRAAKFTIPDQLGEVSASGRFTALKNGSASLTISYAGKTASVPLELAGITAEFHADFVRDVNPILSRVGCNAGTCHGSKDGRNGFKLSLRGYDPLYDVRSFTDDLAARRVNLASPDDSLLLLKATGAVPHEGGQRFTIDSEYYATLRKWISSGAVLNAESARATGIEISPQNPVIQEVGARQQMRILATYADGSKRDVTAEAFIESGNGDVASADSTGIILSLRRGEAPLLARYEGNYTATTLTVMGDRKGFVWKDLPAHNKVDELVIAKWKRMKILPSDISSDTDFIRRVYLDLTGLPPSSTDVRENLADKRNLQERRDALVEKLIGSPEFVDHWASKWGDLLQVNRKFLGEEGALLFRDWVRKQVEINTPYDHMVREILTATGSNKTNAAASYFKILRTPAETMENTTHLFLGTRFNCNKCHDHPFERWTQDQYYQMTAYFAQVDLKKDDASGDKRIGGTAVEGSKPLYEIVEDKKEGEITHDRTGKVTAPAFPYSAKVETSGGNATRRQQLAEWITSPDNRYFALSYVNRLWGYLMGVGLIEPLDDIRAGNPPSNPELLDYLTHQFVESGFNTRHVLRLICKSRAYQLSVTAHEWNIDDKVNFSHATARRLPAETLLDSVYRVTGSIPNVPGVKPGTRAAQLTDSAIDLPSGFLANLGRPARESSCECERSNDIRLGAVMSLLSGPAVSSAVNDPRNDLAVLVAAEPDDRKVVNEVFMRVLNRPASTKEVDSTIDAMGTMEREHIKLIAELGKAEGAWALSHAQKSIARTEAIGKAEKELAGYMVERAPKIAAAQRERNEKIATSEEAVRDYEPTLALAISEWEEKLTAADYGTVWMPVSVKEVRGTGSAKLEKLPDGTIRSTGSGGELPDYVVTAETALTGITGVKLEVLTDETVPAFGPGYKDGNFLLSEFVVESASKTNAAKFAKAKIVDAKTDFIQKEHDLKHTFDGKVEQGRREGWAIGGSVGQPHWAAFKFENSLGGADGAVLKITLQHKYQAPYEIGRFRLWVTTSKAPTADGLPNDIVEALKTSLTIRSPQQLAALMDYHRDRDPEMRKRQQTFATARKPLPDDAKLRELESTLARVSRPIPTDPQLVQTRHDVESSTRQLVNRRLTSAQDLAWALINTPAFLFNR